eukprot:scaffold137136_cov30-Tisochrysis_lutea.AAC.1
MWALGKHESKGPAPLTRASGVLRRCVFSGLAALTGVFANVAAVLRVDQDDVTCCDEVRHTDLDAVDERCRLRIVALPFPTAGARLDHLVRCARW